MTTMILGALLVTLLTQLGYSDAVCMAAFVGIGCHSTR